MSAWVAVIVCETSGALSRGDVVLLVAITTATTITTNTTRPRIDLFIWKGM